MEPLPWITVVSGLPRSGTSLMMQALAAGGLPPLTDAQRAADASNPRGYLELEAVKRLKVDRSWLPQARGKAVKIIHLLLPELVAAVDTGIREEYRVVMMRRPVEEVVASQRAMLARQGKAAAAVPDAQLGKLFVDQLERAERLLAGRPEFRVLTVSYPALMADPAAEMARVNEFLGGGLDASAMARAVDPALYREKRPNN
ncbi:MAG: sulfotransferase [Gluconacetobacter diazotrophicus]|nr:sulfotransferase [Gluconacetobacter diazotrophicus]